VFGLLFFFSISKTKRSEYLQPIYPAMALLVGYAIDRSLGWWDDSLFWRRLISIVTMALILLLSVAYGVGPVVSKKNRIKSAKPFCLMVRRYLLRHLGRIMVCHNRQKSYN
jgi:4-amino-4-deoxy-L-arabinose transferase-like glycosyltransferase